jgi:hypothetical protein
VEYNINQEKGDCCFDEIEGGECFLYKHQILMKTFHGPFCAMDIGTGHIYALRGTDRVQKVKQTQTSVFKVVK